MDCKCGWCNNWVQIDAAYRIHEDCYNEMRNKIQSPLDLGEIKILSNEIIKDRELIKAAIKILQAVIGEST